MKYPEKKKTKKSKTMKKKIRGGNLPTRIMGSNKNFEVVVKNENSPPPPTKNESSNENTIESEPQTTNEPSEDDGSQDNSKIDAINEHEFQSSHVDKVIESILGKNGDFIKPYSQQHFNAFAKTNATIVENAIEDIFEDLFDLNKFGKEIERTIEDSLLNATTEALNKIDWINNVKIYSKNYNVQQDTLGTKISEPLISGPTESIENTTQQLKMNDLDRYNAKKIYMAELNSENPMLFFVKDLLNLQNLEEYITNAFYGNDGSNIWSSIESLIKARQANMIMSLQDDIKAQTQGMSEEDIINQMKKITFVKANNTSDNKIPK